MVFIIAYRLKRKNARRKVYAKIHCIDQYDAVKQFESYCIKRQMMDDKPKEWELLTGDWKHIEYFKEGNENG